LKEENGNPGNKNIMIDLMIRETERLTETIDYFLDFANEKPLSLDYFNIDEMIEQVAETMKLHSYFHDGIKMKLVCRSKPLLILGDRKQLTQVLTNIFLNALQAIKGDGEIIVDYGLNKLKNAVVIKISDTGIGMSPEIISRIFEPFVSSRETGMGLGLPITKKIVEKHSGSITVSSKKGDGATFEITLPVSG
jgi:signal transduction histidine kinase